MSQFDRVPSRRQFLKHSLAVGVGTLALPRYVLGANDQVNVAVIGCGYMGLMLVQCLARSFAEELVGIDVVPQRLELAREFGAKCSFNMYVLPWFN